MSRPPDGVPVVPLHDLRAKEYRAPWVCPSCGRQPRVKLTATMLELASLVEPDTVLQWYDCHCSESFPLSALIVARAVPIAQAA